jgi:putative transposase
VYGGLMLCEVRRLKQLEEENTRLRKLVADLTLDKEMLTEVIKKKDLTATRSREMIDFVKTAFQVAIRRAYWPIPAPRSTYHYHSVRPPQDVLRKRICELSETHVRYG